MTTRINYEIDSDDLLVAVGGDWNAFARENDAEELTGTKVIGRNIFDFISNPDTRALYQTIFSRIRNRTGSLQFPFRCDAPDKRRLIDMSIFGGTDAHLHFVTTVLKTDIRPPVNLPETDSPHPDEIIAICSWCKRVRLSPELWVEIEDAVPVLRPFDRNRSIGVSHSICDDCSQRLEERSSKD